MNEELYEIYEGNEPYLFISYSHQDSEQVEPIIRGLQEMGYRIWYDTGIAVGSRWPDTIADHLLESDCVVAFISRNAMASDYCQEEIFFAMEEHKPIVAVHLEETTLPSGLRMRLSSRQAIYRYRFADDKTFLAKLDKEKVVKASKNNLKISGKHSSKVRDSIAKSSMDLFTEKYHTIPDNLFIHAVDTVQSMVFFKDTMLAHQLGCSLERARTLINQMSTVKVVQETSPGMYTVIMTELEWRAFRERIKIEQALNSQIISQDK